jgi:predicted flap endonuclease-1-like 5' DNA nuclease
MEELMRDPVFYWLFWAIFTIGGTIVGWSLRAGTTEKDVRDALVRVEQEKNTLARLYTHVKHQHDLREADFKRTSLEINTLRSQVQVLTNERELHDPAAQNARVEKAENSAALFAQKVAALELLAESLRSRNAELTAQLSHLQSELDAWQTLYRDFQAMQQKLADFEQNARALEAERGKLQQQLAAAQHEIELLHAELRQHQPPPAKTRADRKAGSAAPKQNDDLKIISGITAVLEQQLISLGINTFAQISRWDDDAIIAFARALSVSPGKIYREDWVGQARKLVGEVG